MESWSHIEIFHSGDKYYESLLQDIREATRSVSIESYIFAIDQLTKAVLDALGEARARGVSVKVVVDGFGSYYTIPELVDRCAEKGIEFRVFHPLPYPLLWLRRVFTKYSLKTSFLFKNMNRRTHRKITIIDEKKAYLGSLNFTQVHCEKWMGSKAWRDTGVLVEGPPIKSLVLAFQISYFRTYVKGMTNWIGRWRQNREPHEDLLRLNSTQKARRRLYKDLLQRFASAEDRIYITTAYFLPKRSLLTALIKASKRGVDVRLLIPGKSDVPVVKWAAYFIVKLLLQKNIRVFEYQKTILHAKTMILDDKTFIGSFNLNHRSVLHDLEVEVILQDSNSLQNMLSQWNQDIQDSRVMSQEKLAPPSWFLRQLYKLAFRLRYML